MSKKITSILCSLTLMFSGLTYIVSQSPTALAANVVLNPGFETAGTGGAADAADWTEGVNHARASDKFNTGAWSLKSTYRSTGTNTSQTVSVSTNTSYTYSLYIWKTTSVGGSCADMSDIVGEVQLCVTTQTGSWQFRSGTWNSGTNTSITLRLITDSSPTGDIWFDDVSLDGGAAPTNTNTASAPTNTPTDTSIPPTNTPGPSGNVVQNSSFEIADVGGAGDAANWTEWPNQVRASDKFNTGAWSLKSTVTTNGATTQGVSVATNTAYTFSGYVWKTNTVGNACIDMADLAGEVQKCTTTAGSWVFLTGPWNSGANTALTVRVYVDGNPTGAIWFDDITLTGPGGPTNTPTNTGVAPSNTPTNTPVPPTNTPTDTPAVPTNTPTRTNTPAPSGNAVQNPSFEIVDVGGAGDAASWTEGINHARASDKFNTGAWSLKSSFLSTGGTDTHQTVSTLANTTYTYSGYIWRAATVGGSCMDMSDILGEVQLCTTATGSWQFLSGSWSSGSNTSVTLRLITDGTPNNNIWFDDISLDIPGTPVPTNTPTKTPTPCAGCPTPNAVIVAGAGDIACGAGSGGASCKQMATSDLLVNMNPDKVIILGDNQYENGELVDYNNFYNPSWGRLKAKTSPAVGNHDYLTTNAAGYFDYFNGAGNQNGPAGDRSKGYYSYNLGAWHLIALNTECSHAGGCAVGNPQYTWLQNDLNAHPECTLVYTHHPRWTSDTRAFDDTEMQDMIQLMYDKGVELLLVGHSHFYERFRRNDPNQNADPNYGIRQIIVGTGGRNVYGFGTIEPGSEVRDSVAFGVIKLALTSTNYTWDFLPAAGYSFTDHGSESCHGAHP